LVVFFFSCAAAMAFPPAPHYTLYGIVRDQVGQTVTAEGAEVVLLRGSAEIGRTPISSAMVDQNYELNVKIDQNRTGTAPTGLGNTTGFCVTAITVTSDGQQFGAHRDDATSQSSTAMTHWNRHADGAASSALKHTLRSSGICTSFFLENKLDDCLSEIKKYAHKLFNEST
jgi:hypothetical protein